MKVFELCTGHGYTVRMKIYARKNLEVKKTTLTAVIFVLCKPILRAGQFAQTSGIQVLNLLTSC